ncbi:MAG: dipeptidase [Hyphomonadaceae bacterium]|nr:MAG: membrane dipeptidase [Caulobacteraceae bacterium]MBT9444234.1 dipeptidase [Hyphomonadaceae bacterium]TPW06156.1 MAG: membrane dipeptidase [Alphaproteobacteria bacterium]
MVRHLIAALALFAPLFAAPALAQPAPPTRVELARIDRILHRTPLIDGHNDLPWEIRESFGGDLARVDLAGDTTKLTPPLHTDIPRLRAGRLGAQFWSVYVPAALKGRDSTEAVQRQIDLTRRIVQAHPGTFEQADSAADIVRIHRAGRIASMFGIEGGEAINGDLALLREFRASGVLYMTLTHSTTNGWVDSATDAPKYGGLSPFGEDVVREMNRIGMLVDLSHVSQGAMEDALRVSTAPVIFSHSSARALAHHPRNVPDEVLRLLPANGGVVMVNFFPVFLSDEFWRWSAARAAEEARLKALNPAAPDAVKEGLVVWGRANPQPATSVATVADHIEHIRRVAGVDHVGIGSDFDGVSALPEGLGGVDAYPALFVELMRRGWSDADLAKLAGGNVLRALRGAERVAAAH